MRRPGVPSPAMVVALLALVVALGGSAYAALNITGKDVKNRSLSGKDLKKDSLKGSEIVESKLGKVPAAAQADSAAQADRAAQAANAGTLGGLPASAFVGSSKLYSGYVTAGRGEMVQVFNRGPFLVELNCVLAYSGEDRAAGQLRVTVATPSRTNANVSEPASGGADLPAGTPRTLNPATGSGGNSASTFAQVGAYFDTTGGRGMDISGRVRVNHLGSPWCSAFVSASFTGL